MVTISLCMIVRDEEATIERCLKSVAGIVDEINIVDTGSVDRTKEIVGNFTDRIYDFEWIDDFGAARNYSFSKATKDFVLWLDADDVIAEADRERFIQLKQSLTDLYDRVTMPYLLAYDNSGQPTSSLRRNRLVRRACHFQWVGAVHEYLNAFGSFLDSDVCVSHRKAKAYTDRNLRIYEHRTNAGEQFSTRDLYYYANELRDHQMHDKAVLYYDKMLKTGEGWIEDNIQACLKMADCYGKLNQKEQQFLALTRALYFEKPRAEILCAFGNYFFEEKQYRTAIYWYEQATVTEQNKTMGMTDQAASTWFPHLQLCLCYDRLQQFAKAYECNEKAAAFNPNHPSMIYNRRYFRDTHKMGRSFMTNKTSIIILTHNQLPITQLCLDSIRRYTDEPYELVVVDNGSTDATVDYLKSQTDVKVILNDHNLGFAKGCNQGMQAATGDTLLFLNNDTIVTSNWLTAMLRVLYKDENVGIVGPVTNYASGQQQIAIDYEDLAGIHTFAETHVARYSGLSFEVRRIVGFCMLIKRKVFEEIGGFDERYGLGNYEDDDVCLKVLKRGYRLRIAYDCYIHHFGHMTMNILPDANLSGLLTLNREKAKEKWGQDIHSLIYKEPATLSIVLPVDRRTRGELEVILAQIQHLAEEIIVLNRDDSGPLGPITLDKVKIIELGTASAEDWWPRVVAESTKQFLFWLNPREQLSAENQRKLFGLKLTLTDQVDAVSLLLQIENAATAGGEPSIVRRNRIVRREATFRWNAIIHDFLLEPNGRVEYSDIVIY